MLLPATYDPGVQTPPTNTQSMVLAMVKLGTVTVTAAVAPVVFEVAVGGPTTQVAVQFITAVLL
jgi:hypothetical protein